VTTSWLRVAVLAAITFLVATPARAFEIRARSDNPLISADAMKARALEIAAEIGTRIPDDPRIRVSVYSRSHDSRIAGSQIYLHRIQLTKAFTSTAPYPYAGYLPLRSVERYGVDAEAGVREQFDEALRAFFRQMLAQDPNRELE
jgi:hypothetical protein